MSLPRKALLNQNMGMRSRLVQESWLVRYVSRQVTKAWNPVSVPAGIPSPPSSPECVRSATPYTHGFIDGWVKGLFDEMDSSIDEAAGKKVKRRDDSFTYPSEAHAGHRAPLDVPKLAPRGEEPVKGLQEKERHRRGVHRTRRWQHHFTTSISTRR